MSEFSLILVLQKENKQNSNMTWQKYKLNLRNSHLLQGNRTKIVYSNSQF